MRKKRILLIDDESSFTRMLKLNLEKTGAYEVRAENRGREGLAAARQFKRLRKNSPFTLRHAQGERGRG